MIFRYRAFCFDSFFENLNAVKHDVVNDVLSLSVVYAILFSIRSLFFQ